jgi:hypothetical protein
MENGEHYPGTSQDLLCSMWEVDRRREAESSLMNSLPFTDRAIPAFECSFAISFPMHKKGLQSSCAFELLAISWQIFINCWLGPCAFECLLQSIGFAISFPINCKAIQDNL